MRDLAQDLLSLAAVSIFVAVAAAYLGAFAS